MPAISLSREAAAVLEPLFAEPVNRFVLPNGLVVIHQEDRSSDLVSAQVWVRTGSIHEGQLLGSGLSHYLEHLLFKGTRKRGPGQIAADVQALGGNINAYTTFDRTVYYIDAPSEHLGRVLDILADMTWDSTLPEDEVRKERDVILREIDMGLDDPDRQVSRAIFRTAFREHPYRHPVIGHRELFEQVTHEDLVAYYRQRYAPNNAVLVVVGAVDEATLRTELEAAVGARPMTRVETALFPEEPAQLAPREEHLTGDVTVCRAGMAFRVPGLRYPHAPALDVLGLTLGYGRSSRLWQALREERRLVHHIEASVWNPGAAGLLWVSFVCDPDKHVQAEAAIRDELVRLAEKPLREEEVDKARRQALVGEINLRKTMSGQASRLGLTEVVIGDISYPRRYLERLQAVTAEQLTQLAQEFLVPDQMTTVSLMPTGHSRVRLGGALRGRQRNEFELRTLANGARLVYQRDARLPKVHLRLSGFGGPVYESAAERGVTSLMATLLTRDTRGLSAREVASAAESLGAQFSEFAGNNSFGLTFECLSQDVEMALPLLSAAVREPLFAEETLQIEREAQIAQIQEDLDEIVDRGRRSLRRHFFGEHPLATDAYGDIDCLQYLRPAHVRAHYERLVCARNLVLSICGDFTAQQLELFEELLLSLPETPFAPRPTRLNGHQVSEPYREVMAREQAVVFQAFPDTGVRGEDYLVGELLDEIFSDMSGHLFYRVREDKALAYFVGASRVLGLEDGMFYLYGGTHPRTAQVVMDEIAGELERLRSGGLTEAEFTRARTRLKAQKRMQMQSPGARAAEAGLNVLYGQPVNHWQTFDARLDAIDMPDLQRFAQTYLAEDKRVSLIIGPEG